MNLPNKITVLRIIMIPIFVALFMMPGVPHNLLWAFAVFALASLTDMLDGRIARKRGLITDFGILMDPLADKLLVMAAMVCFVEAGVVRAWVVVVILAREFLVTSIRLVAAGKGQVIAADKWGKIKTVLQMLWICNGLICLWMSSSSGLEVVRNWPSALQVGLGRLYLVFMIMVVFFTVLSGVNYVVKNRQLFADA